MPFVIIRRKLTTISFRKRWRQAWAFTITHCPNLFVQLCEYMNIFGSLPFGLSNHPIKTAVLSFGGIFLFWKKDEIKNLVGQGRELVDFYQQMTANLQKITSAQQQEQVTRTLFFFQFSVHSSFFLCELEKENWISNELFEVSEFSKFSFCCVSPNFSVCKQRCVQTRKFEAWCKTVTQRERFCNFSEGQKNRNRSRDTSFKLFLKGQKI